MSKWLGFCVGFAVALTALLTVVRPATSPREATLQTARVATDKAQTPFAASAHSAPEQHEREDPQRSAPAKSKTATDPALTMGDVSPDLVSHPAPAPTMIADPPADKELAQAPPGARELVRDTFPGDAPVPDTRGTTDMHRDAAVAPDVTLTRLPNADAMAPHDDPTNASPATRQWYAFWQPFGSELSAQGFSRRLERLTGLDYRVVKIDAGEYHVAVGYDDEPGRIANLDAIEAATGLQLDGQSL